MRKVLLSLPISILLLTQIDTTVAADLKTVTLAVDGMTCNMCPITVKKALKKVEGVT